MSEAGGPVGASALVRDIATGAELVRLNSETDPLRVAVVESAEGMQPALVVAQSHAVLLDPYAAARFATELLQIALALCECTPAGQLTLADNLERTLQVFLAANRDQLAVHIAAAAIDKAKG